MGSRVRVRIRRRWKRRSRPSSRGLPGPQERHRSYWRCGPAHGRVSRRLRAVARRYMRGGVDCYWYRSAAIGGVRPSSVARRARARPERLPKRSGEGPRPHPLPHTPPSSHVRPGPGDPPAGALGAADRRLRLPRHHGRRRRVRRAVGGERMAAPRLEESTVLLPPLRRLRSTRRSPLHPLRRPARIDGRSSRAARRGS